MPSSAYLRFVAEILNQTIFLSLAVGAVFALLVGAMLLLDSERAFRIGDFLNRWVSTRAAIRPLEEHHDVRRPLYRMHRLVGVLICAGAVYSLAVLGTPKGAAAIGRAFAGLGSPLFSSWLAESLRLLLLTGNFAAFVFGLVFIVRPSALRGLEQWADRRVSGRQSAKPLETMYRPADSFARAHPRLLGAVVVAGSLYVLANLGYALLPR